MIPSGVQAAEKGHDDRGEAVARRDLRNELTDWAGDFESSGEARQAAADQQAEPDDAVLAEAGEAGRGRRLADDADLEADDGEGHDHPAGHRDQNGDQGAHMHARELQHDVQQGRIREHARLREVVAVGVHPGTKDQQAQEESRHIGQHQAGQDLVDVEAGLQEGGNGGIGHAAQDARDAHQRQDIEALVAPKGECHAAAGDGADGELPLCADVPDIGPEAHRQADADHDQRPGLHHQLAQAIDREKG